MRILVTDGMDQEALLLLKGKGHEVVERFYEPEELGAALREFDIVIVRSATKVRQKQIDAAKGGRLKLILRGGVGVDNIDVAYANAAGIDVKNTPRASSNAVAELALGLMFSCARNLSIAGHTMREGKWEKKAYSKGFELAGKTLGVLGYGRIGQAIGAKAQALGMNVLAYDVYRVDALECDTMRYAEMDRVLAQSDILSLHTPTIEGKPLINAETIAKMKDGAVLINTSRGANVDEAALVEALKSGKLRAAGLDVYADEPAPNKELLSLPNVSCTPHIGAGTQEAQKRIGMELVDIVTSFAQ